MTHIIITLTIHIEKVGRIPWCHTTWRGKQAPFTSQSKRLNTDLSWKEVLVPMHLAKMKEQEW